MNEEEYQRKAAATMAQTTLYFPQPHFDMIERALTAFNRVTSIEAPNKEAFLIRFARWFEGLSESERRLIAQEM